MLEYVVPSFGEKRVVPRFNVISTMTRPAAMRPTLVCGLAFLFWFGACGSAYAQSSSQPFGVLLLLLGIGGAAGTAGAALLLNSRRKIANARKLLGAAEHSGAASSEPQD